MHTANVYGGFPAISMEKCCTNHRETLYSSSLYTYVVGKPYNNIYRLQEKSYDRIGFHRNL